MQGRDFLAEFDTEMANTRKLLALVPDDKLDWQPHPRSMKLGRLAGHLAEMPDWAIHALTLPSMSLTDENGKPRYEAFNPASRAEILAKFDRDLPAAREVLANASASDLEHQWKMDWQGQVFIDMPREQVIRIWTLNHMIHHRAQLGVYLRLNDIAIPGMYGPSSDEMPS